MLIAGAIAALAPDSFWQHFFLRSTSSYTAMVAAGYLVELVFGGLGIVPDQARATPPSDHVTWIHTTFLHQRLHDRAADGPAAGDQDDGAP